jgi:glyoxylase-like metal-dependent hydrolase (beta-lactamase superfamily II)
MPVAIGSAQLERIEEQHIPVSFSLLTPAGGGPAAGDGTFQFSNHGWLVRVDGLTVLVDPCNGNGRRRQVPFFNDLNLPWLDRLRAAGAAPEEVDIVFCTHLHSDHCGWNTTRVGGRWVPTFPRAEYLFADEEYRRWDPAAPHANQYNESVFDECVRPVVAAGQARIITPPFVVADSLTVETAPGHTAGHALLRLESRDERAYFTGDAFHHPVQVERPELCLPGCDDPAQAVATRRALVSRLERERAYLFPAHFAAPHYGRVERQEAGFRFMPAAIGALA